MHPQTPAWPPPPQVCGGVHSPQLSALPQSSVAGPHSIPCELQVVVGTQAHSPQSSGLPQLSLAAPHSIPSDSQVSVGMQTHSPRTQDRPSPQSALEQHTPGSRQTPPQTIWPVGQQSSSP